MYLCAFPFNVFSSVSFSLTSTSGRLNSVLVIFNFEKFLDKSFENYTLSALRDAVARAKPAAVHYIYIHAWLPTSKHDYKTFNYWHQGIMGATEQQMSDYSFGVINRPDGVLKQVSALVYICRGEVDGCVFWGVPV